MVQCTNCTHVYSSPLPVRLWENYVSVVDHVYLENQAARYATAEKVLARIRRFCPQGRLLDIGCATGDFLYSASKYYQVEGLELSSWSAKFTRDRGIVVHEDLLSTLKGEGMYDVITLWGVVEHFENPQTEIKNIARLLKPGGIVCFWTPNVSSIPAQLLGKKWWNVLGQHIQLFSRASLCRLLNSQGLKTEWVGLHPYVMSVDSILNSFRRYPLVSNVVKVIARVFPSDLKVTVIMPGEMFAIFRKS